jgi:EAL domain-containing protein (putative c-di-GMP-specific phosphodiesterase class I)
MPDFIASTPQHPAPERDRVSARRLWFGLLAAPAAWALAEMLLYFLSSRNCAMKSSTLAEQLTRGEAPGVVMAAILSFALAAAGVIVSLGNWRRSRHEKAASEHHLAESGEGRTRFIALCGLLTSAGFVAGFVFLAAGFLVAPLC